MKNETCITRLAATAALLLASATASAAPIVATASATDLIGHSLEFLRAYPDTSTQYGLGIPGTTVVQGSADAVQWRYDNSQPAMSGTMIDPDADRITLSFLETTAYIGAGAGFDGYLISGFDYDIASVTVLSNGSAYAVDLSFGLRSISIDLNGASAAGNLVLAVTLADPNNGVPEPGSLALAAAAFAGLVLTRRRRT